MSRRVPGSLTPTLVALGLVLLLIPALDGVAGAPRAARPNAVAPAQRAAIASQYGELPLAFETNAGQADAAVRFLAHGSGYTLGLTPSAALLALQAPAPVASSPRDRAALPAQPAAAPTLLGMRWLDANPTPAITGEEALPGTVNYFIGNDPAQWHTNIPTYQQVRLHEVYPGVDLVYYGTNGHLEYDFVVAPGADPSRIALGFSGASQVGVDLAGNLSLALPGGAIAQQKPLVYQTAADGARRAVAGGYTLAGGGRVGFALGVYNPHLSLVIDPAYRYSTFLGGSDNDAGSGISMDASGNTYITGSTASSDFPTLDPAQANNAGPGDVFVTKFNATGSALIYSTYIGGSGDDGAGAIAVDSGGNAYVSGETHSTDFPTVGPLQASKSGGYDVFVSKLNASGSTLLYSTYLGGINNDRSAAIAVDGSGNAYVTGYTQSADFPLANPLQATYSPSTGGGNLAFTSKLNSAGSALVYSTYWGGTGNSTGEGIAVDASGNAYAVGETTATDLPVTMGALQTTAAGGGDMYVSKFNASGTALLYSTYLGGTDQDIGQGIAVDESGNAYIAGYTYSTDFPLVDPFQASESGGYDAVVSKLNAAGSALLYSTYLGGGGDDAFLGGIAIDSEGHAYVAGRTLSGNFPLVSPLQSSLHGSEGDFVSELDASGSGLIFSTYLGGSSGEDYVGGVAADGKGNVYVSGWTQSADFPVVNALDSTLRQADAFIAKIYTGPTPVTTTGVFRPSNGVLYLKNANTTGPADITLYYGQPGDQPITGDWTGKGYKSIGIYRSGTFYLRNSNTTGYADIVVPFGNSTDIPVAGDWTGKGYDSIGVYRPSTNTFLLRNSNTAGAPDIVARLGISGDVPIVGDWTGKGFDSIGVFRPSNGIVYLRNSNSTGVADINFVYGIAGDKPVVGDWDANGTDTIGVDRNGRFLLRNSNTTGPANLSFYLGVSGDDPIAGPWLAPA